MARGRFLVSILLLIICSSKAVDRSKFKTCDQSSFCKRNRALPKGESPYEVLPDSLVVGDDSLEAIVVNSKNKVEFSLVISSLKSNTIHMTVNEKSPLSPRYVVQNALVDGIAPIKGLMLESKDNEKAVVKITTHTPHSTVEVKFKPMVISVYSGDELVISANSRGLFNFEHLRKKKSAEEHIEDGEEQPKEEAEHQEEDEPGMWEEHFQSHFDSKPFGPEAVACDFSFHNAEEIYGVPEHADTFALKETTSTDPYRLYNLDVFEYEAWNPMALYASIPFIISMGEKRSAGLLWLNAAETWIDVKKGPESAVMTSIVNLMSGGSTKKPPQMDTHWISESGIVDVYFLMGPGPKDIMSQLTTLSGSTPLPPEFAFGFHHSRWNYNDEQDVKTVDVRFDEVNFPYDFLWLDIEHTDGKKYFTWDSVKFPRPVDMINTLAAKGRKMVTIVDPHIKKDSGYFVHTDAQSNDLYVKNKDGKEYDGWCWPGASGYLDFLDPRVREYWAKQFDLNKYQGSTLDLYTWNDMNEPSVFNGPEVTMHKDALHFGNWEHRDVHNLYGFYHVMSTFEGHLLRSGGAKRPFILTRAAFLGSQRYAAIWTGDNTAEWDHLKLTIPMCLSLSVAGMGFCGADVGGFFKNTDEELLTRWYQAAAFQPFFRVHSHIETARREPYLFSEAAVNRLRAAVLKRYTFMPYWYTLFYEYEKTGVPPMRPLWMEFPADANTLKMDDQHMLGSALLVAPVLDSGASTLDVYFPGTKSDPAVWYDVDSLKRHDNPGFDMLSVTMDSIPVYQRGGTIVPRKMRPRRASSLMHRDPFTLFVALDREGKFANGTLYLDDGDGYEYRSGKYAYIVCQFEGNVLSARNINSNSGFTTPTWLERVVIVGLETAPKSVSLSENGGAEKELGSKYDPMTKSLVVRKPGVIMTTAEWKIALHF